MSRIDLFLFAHKGLRRAMFDVAIGLAATDFAEPSTAADALAAARRVLGFLREHAQHEDGTIFPALARHNPALAAGLQSEHGLIAGHEARFEHLLARFEAAPASARAAIGRHLLAQWHRIVSHHLAHLEREEEEGNRVLQACCTDAELGGLMRQVLAGIAPARRAEWQELIVAGLSAAERELLRQRLMAQESR